MRFQLEMNKQDLKNFLDEKVSLYNSSSFIAQDPVSIPHQFRLRQDIEIMGFFAATLAWGQRMTIIKNCNYLTELMEGEPYNFLLNHNPKDLNRFSKFVHRTFNPEDACYFIRFLSWYYSKNTTLETAFSSSLNASDPTVENALTGFCRLFFSLPNYPHRTRKHVANPGLNSACKRLNMFLRWMVRKDNKGVDFGIWNSISPAQLICPLDVHSGRVARQLGLLQRQQNDWAAALELTANLRQLNPDDPASYDFALFGLGVEGYF
jgi:uncharacterized protein (TIGR02757 family)